MRTEQFTASVFAFYLSLTFIVLLSLPLAFFQINQIILSAPFYLLYWLFSYSSLFYILASFLEMIICPLTYHS